MLSFKSNIITGTSERFTALLLVVSVRISSLQKLHAPFQFFTKKILFFTYF